MVLDKVLYALVNMEFSTLMWAPQKNQFKTRLERYDENQLFNLVHRL